MYKEDKHTRENLQKLSGKTVQTVRTPVYNFDSFTTTLLQIMLLLFLPCIGIITSE